MASLWKQLRGNRAQVQRGPDPQEIRTALAAMGINVMVTPEGEMVPIPAGASDDDVKSFADRWNALTQNSGPSPEGRENRLKTYQQMDADGSEAAVVLDTYADEVVNVVDYSDRSLQISISNEKVLDAVMQVLSRNQVLSNTRSDIRDLCQFGDFAYSLTNFKGESLLQLSPTELSGNCSAVAYKPEDLMVSYLNAGRYKAEADAIDVFRLQLEGDPDGRGQGAALRVKGELQPWEFSMFRINSRKTAPYGLSILEKMRAPWEKLTLLEELLAITRANRLDRIAFTVPGIKGDPTSVVARLSQLKNSIKNLILGHSSGGKVSRNQDTGMTEWLWLPEGYKVERLSTSIEVSSIEDVEYFRDKLINASRMPKGFFLASESGSTPRPMSLRQQDIKFARSLIPVGEAYCRGLTKLIYLIAFYLGHNIGSLKVRVGFKRSPYLSDELLQTYGDIYSIIDQFKQLRNSMSKSDPITDVDIKRVLDLVGAPHELVFPEEVDRQQKREALSESLQPVFTTLESVIKYET